MAGIAEGRGRDLFRPLETTWAERLLSFAERSHARAAALLLLLALLCFLPGFASLQPMDRDEPRFAQATKQMLERRDFVDIRFQDEARYKKPVGIHWLQAASVEVVEALGRADARTAIWAYRIPSLLGAGAAVLLGYWAALAFGTRREAFLAAALLAASVILSVEARLAKTDAVLLACCVAAMGGLARAWLGRAAPLLPTSTVLVFWAAVASGILVKGPLVVMFAGLAALCLAVRERSGRWLGRLRPKLGLAIVALAVLPWFGLIAWTSGGEFFRLAVGDDMLGKVATGQQKHFAPPGFYLLAFFATFWPGAILAAIAVPFAWRERGEDRVEFLLAWIVPSWLLFEAVPTKLPHYVMPLYPAVAILTVLAVARGYVGPHRPGARAAFGAMPLIPLGLLALFAGWGWSQDGTVPAAGLALLAASLLVSLAAWLFFSRGEVTRSALAGLGASALLSAGVFGLVQPVLGSLKVSPRLAEALRAAGCPGGAVATLGYREPSLVFLAGTDLRMLENGADAARFLAGGGCRALAVDSRFEPAFLQALGDRSTRDPVGRIDGFNINGGRRVSLRIYAAGR